MRLIRSILLTMLLTLLGLYLGGCGTKYYILEVAFQGSGTVNEVDASGTLQVAAGTLVTLTPVAANGWAHSGWIGPNGAEVAANKILVDGDKKITAVFKRLKYNLVVNEVGTGAVTVTLVEAAKSVNQQFNAGDKVRLTASTVTGWQLKGWKGDLTGSQNPIEFVMTKDMAIEAEFEVEPCEITKHTTWGAAGQSCGVDITFTTPKDPSITKVNIYRRHDASVKPYENVAVVRESEQVWRDEGPHLVFNEVYWYKVVVVGPSGQELTAGTEYRVFMGVQNPASTLYAPQWPVNNAITTGWNGTSFFVTAQWNAVTSGGVGGPYTYELKYTYKGATNTVSVGTGTAWTQQFDTPGVTLACQVRVVDAENNKSGWSTERSIAVGGQVPKAPEITYCESVPGTRTIRLNWLPITADVNDNAIDVANYRVYRSDNNGSYVLIYTSPTKDVTTWDDTTLPPAGGSPVPYRYCVTAVSTASVESAKSNIERIDL